MLQARRGADNFIQCLALGPELSSYKQRKMIERMVSPPTKINMCLVELGRVEQLLMSLNVRELSS